MKKALFVGFLIFASALVPRTRADAPEPGQAAVWQAVGPDGGWIKALAMNPKNESELYAAVDSSPCQVFKSSNAGKTWERVGLVQRSLHDLAVHPSNSNILFGLASTSILKSKDQGRTFTEYEMPDAKRASLVGNISISPREPDTIFVAGTCQYDSSGGKYCLAVYKSTNAGQSWKVSKIEPVTDWASEPTVAVSPVDPKIVFVCGTNRRGTTTYNRVFKSTDGGTRWTDITGAVRFRPRALLLHPQGSQQSLRRDLGRRLQELGWRQDLARAERSERYLCERPRF